MILQKMPIKAHDRTLETAWRMTLSVLIFAVAVCSLCMIYCGFFAIINHHWPEAAGFSAVSILLGGAVVWLCYNRNDIVGSL